RENAVRLLLVGRKFHGDVRRAARDRRLDALLIAAVAKLDETLLVQPQPRDVACFGRMDDTRRARPEGATLCVANELVATSGKIEGVVEMAGRTKLARQ